MASNYKSLKCDCCAGALEYNKRKKVWVCLYCGNEIRREEEYDGLFTIKNVVKQTLMDLSSGLMDNAVRNLAECEKIDPRYVGTLLARLAVNLFTVITGACQPGAVKGIFGKIKRDYDALRELDSAISTEEEALYESFEDSSDAFGVLYLTFDSIGDAVHKDFIEKMMDCGRIYSRSLNENLLNLFMKNGKRELADQVLANVDNIDCHSALFRVIRTYEDGEGKRAHVLRLAECASVQPDDRREVETYLKESSDCDLTKRTVYGALAKAGAAAAMNFVTEYLLAPAGDDGEAVREIIAAVCEQRPNDQELYYLLERVMLQHSGPTAIAELETLTEHDIFVAMSSKYITAMLERRDLTVPEKIRMLELCHLFRMDAKADDAVLSAWLLGSSAPAEEREVMLPVLLANVKTIATATLENYVLTCTLDGERKPWVLEQIFGLELNMSFFRDLLKKYMQRCPDSPDVRAEIIRLLGDSGLQVDPATLIEMACNATDENVESVASAIDKAIRGGTRMPHDALSIYLEQCGKTGCYPALMGLLHVPGGRISAEALNNYVLYSQDDGAVKARNALVFAEQSGLPFGSTTCRVTHLGRVITCNLLQGYVLTTDDPEPVATQLVGAMLQARTKLNPQINAGGVNMTFKKYAQENRDRLSALTTLLCEDNKVFSLFF